LFRIYHTLNAALSELIDELKKEFAQCQTF
jgi:hypothetical protein